MKDAFSRTMEEIERINRMVPSLDILKAEMRRTEELRSYFEPKLPLQSRFLDSQQLRSLSEQIQEVNKFPIADLAANLSRDLLSPAYQEFQRQLEHHTILVPPLVAEFRETFSQLVGHNRNALSEMQGELERNRQLFAPFLQAEAEWRRTLQFPSFTDLKFIAGMASDLAAQITTSWQTLASESLTSLSPDEERSLRLAEERFSQILEEKNPRTTIYALREFFQTFSAKLPPSIRHLLYALLIHVLVQFVTDMAHTSHKPAACNCEKRPNIVKQIKAEAKQLQRTQGLLIPSDARVVIVSQLIVRSEPSQRSRPIGRLFAGDIIYVERKRTRSWSLVDYESFGGESALRGWVFSRYIKRLSGGGR